MKSLFRFLLVLAVLMPSSCKETEVNEPPVIQNQIFSVPENSPAGTQVGQVVATDPDGDPLSYRIAQGNAEFAFALEESSGLLSVSNPEALDYEIRKNFSLTIEVSDGDLRAQASVLVSITNLDHEPGHYNPRTFSRNGNSLPYQILYPFNYEESSSLPLLVFLHGAGERGNDNKAQLIHGSSLFRDSIEEYPAIVVFPQCSAEEYWSSSFDGPLEPANPSMALVEALLDSLLNHEKIDPDRVYTAGLSMGGFGTAQLLAKFPDRFAAGVVICGGAPLSHKEDLKKTPTWIFHGLADKIVDPQNSQDYFSAIDDGLGTNRLTLYEGVGHESWDHAFAEPDFLSWIFSRSKP